MAAHKFTRKDLKKDPFVENTEKVLEFIQSNATAMGVGLLVLVVLLIGGTYMRKGQESARIESSYLLYHGQTLLVQGDHDLAMVPLSECIEQHGGTDAGKFARVAMVRALLGAGQTEDAKSSLEAYRREIDPKHPAHAQLEQLQAYVLADEGRFEEAATALGDLITPEMPDAMTIDLTMLRASWLQKAGQPLAAHQLLQDLEAAIEAGQLDAGGQASELERRLETARALSI